MPNSFATSGTPSCSTSKRRGSPAAHAGLRACVPRAPDVTFGLDPLRLLSWINLPWGLDSLGV